MILQPRIQIDFSHYSQSRSKNLSCSQLFILFSWRCFKQIFLDIPKKEESEKSFKRSIGKSAASLASFISCVCVKFLVSFFFGIFHILRFLLFRYFNSVHMITTVIVLLSLWKLCKHNCRGQSKPTSNSFDKKMLVIFDQKIWVILGFDKNSG